MSVEIPETFLDLCQRTRQECGVSGTGPAAVTSQTGEAQRLVSWVTTAWTYIQAIHQDWDFLRTSASWTTTAAQETYTTAQCGIAAKTFGMWDRYTFRNYITAEGTDSEIFMDYKEYDVWRDSYFYSGFRSTTTRPIVFTITPSKSIALGPPPLAGYTITGDYFTAPIGMTADADEPVLPIQYRMMIVYKAMMFYGRFESAPEVFDGGQIEYKKILTQLENDRLPEPTFAGALV